MRLRLPLHGRSHLPQGSDPIPGFGDFIRYDYLNVGDWLHVETTTPDVANATTNFGNVEQLFITGSFVFKDADREIGFVGGAWLGYLDGGAETVYLQGGDFLRYTGGGNAIFYTFEGASAAGDFAVHTGSSTDTGDVLFDVTDAGGGSDGKIQLLGGDTAKLEILANGDINLTGGSGDISISSSGNVFAGNITTVAGTGDVEIYPGSTETVNLSGGGMTVVKDSGGNPIFEVREDASIHIKTGQTVTADL